MDPLQTTIQPEVTATESQLKFPLDPVTQNILKAYLNQAPLPYLYGTVLLSSGVATITNIKIKATSVILITSFSSASPAIQYAANCSGGSATIFETSHTSADTINYLIIF